MPATAAARGVLIAQATIFYWAAAPAVVLLVHWHVVDRHGVGLACSAEDDHEADLAVSLRESTEVRASASRSRERPGERVGARRRRRPSTLWRCADSDTRRRSPWRPPAGESQRAARSPRGTRACANPVGRRRRGPSARPGPCSTHKWRTPRIESHDRPTPSGDPRSALWWLQLGLNAAWSPIFFGARRPGAGAAVVCTLVPTVAATAAATARVDRRRGPALRAVPRLVDVCRRA